MYSVGELTAIYFLWGKRHLECGGNDNYLLNTFCGGIEPHPHTSSLPNQMLILRQILLGQSWEKVCIHFSFSIALACPVFQFCPPYLRTQLISWARRKREEGWKQRKLGLGPREPLA